MLIVDKIKLKIQCFCYTHSVFQMCGHHTWLTATVFSSTDYGISPSLVKVLLDRGREWEPLRSLALDCHSIISSFLWFLCLFPFFSASLILPSSNLSFQCVWFLNSVRQVCNNSNYGLFFFPPEFLLQIELYMDKLLYSEIVDKWQFYKWFHGLCLNILQSSYIHCFPSMLFLKDN